MGIGTKLRKKKYSKTNYKKKREKNSAAFRYTSSIKESAFGKGKLANKWRKT